MNESNSKVMRYLRYVNVGRIDTRLNGEPFAEIDRFKFLESQVAVDGECENDISHRMSQGYEELIKSAEKNDAQ